jgi:hypothetical protein
MRGQRRQVPRTVRGRRYDEGLMASDTQAVARSYESIGEESNSLPLPSASSPAPAVPTEIHRLPSGRAPTVTCSILNGALEILGFWHFLG